MQTELTEKEAADISEILARRANDVASFLEEHRKTAPGSVELALTREITRLRKLAAKIAPPRTESEE